MTNKCPRHGEYPAYRKGFNGKQYPVDQCPDCAAEVLAEKERVEAERKRQEKINALRRQSGVPPRYQDKRLSSVLNNQITSQSLRWLSRYLEVLPERLSVGASGSFCGDCGTGKTLLGCAMVNEVIEKGYSAKYTTAWQLIQDIRKAYTFKEISINGQIKTFIDYDFLVIDEIGVQSGTNDERVLIYQVIDGRYNAMKSTILISNLSDPVEDGFLDVRTIDRLKENGGFNLALTGPSYRENSLKNERK